MVYWSTVILAIDNDGYHKIYRRTYLWYTWYVVMMRVDNESYHNIHHIAYLWYSGLP
jgi:hypothetical protein